MMTFKVTNTRIENDTIIVFYEFSNGISMTNRFPLTASFVDIMAWGNSKAEWLVARDAEIALLQEQLVEEVADGNSGS